jgi:hypothetical protein
LAGEAGTVPVVDELQVTVTALRVKLTFVDGAVPFAVAVKPWPAGVTVVDWANADEVPSQIIAAIASATRWTIDLPKPPPPPDVSRLTRIFIASMAVLL